MPVSWGTLFRVVVLLLMAVHVFLMYSLARSTQSVVGLHALAIGASGLFALAMLVPLVWAAALPDLPLILRRHQARRRWARGRCAQCGCNLLPAEGGACPECGTERGEPAPYRVGWAAARRFGGFALAAWLLGGVAAEGWACLDEASFSREAKAYLAETDHDQYTRHRRWPMRRVRLYYTVADGVSADTPHPILPHHTPAPPFSAELPAQ